ncbi:MAG: flavodoxin domain-containing protein, partial [Clostridia bacterium]
MNVLVAYASKTGTTQRAAAKLAERIAQSGAKAELVNLNTAAPDCAAYDAVAIGGSIRMGLLHHSAKKYIAANVDKLQSLPVGFFCCRCGKDDPR